MMFNPNLGIFQFLGELERLLRYDCTNSIIDCFFIHQRGYGADQRAIRVSPPSALYVRKGAERKGAEWRVRQRTAATVGLPRMHCNNGTTNLMTRSRSSHKCDS